MRVSVEVCAASLAEALAAASAGVDSVELCSWLMAGGVTPSVGLVRVVRARCACPVRVLVRPHGGGFHYGPDERAVIEADAEAIGGPLVVGALDAAGLPDRHTLVRLSPGRDMTFHRALDHAKDPLEAASIIEALGFGRILTAGGSSTALEGAGMLRRMVQQFKGGTVAAAGGIRPENVVELVERTGVTEVHFAAQLPLASPVGPALSSGPMGTVHFGPDPVKIEGVLNALTKAGLR